MLQTGGLFTNVNKHPLHVNHIGNPIKLDYGWSLPELKELAGARQQKQLFLPHCIMS